MLKFRTPKASESQENTSKSEEPIFSLSIRINEKILLAILTLLLSSSFVVTDVQQNSPAPTPSPTPVQNTNSRE